MYDGPERVYELSKTRNEVLWSEFRYGTRRIYEDRIFAHGGFSYGKYEIDDGLGGVCTARNPVLVARSIARLLLFQSLQSMRVHDIRILGVRLECSPDFWSERACTPEGGSKESSGYNRHR